MTEPEAIRWIAGVFAEPPEKLTPETPRAEIIDWDSLGVLTLMASLDSDFGVVLTDDELQELKSVGHILDVLRRNGKLN